jgi:uncharacterized membrane protein YfcA
MPLPFDLTPGGAAFMAIIFLVAAFVRGYSGFGFSALVVAGSALVTNPLNFVAVVMFCEFGMTFQQWRSIWRDVDWARVTALMAGAILGLPLGLWALTGAGVDVARAVVAIYVLFMCGVMLMGWRIAPQGVRGHLGVGVISGLANAPGMGGLPVATYFTAQGISATTFRATLIAYFAVLDLYSAPVMWLHGLVTWDTLYAAALSVPIIAAGIWAGSRHFLRTDPQDFRRFAIFLLAGLAVMGLLKSVI